MTLSRWLPSDLLNHPFITGKKLQDAKEEILEVENQLAQNAIQLAHRYQIPRSTLIKNLSNTMVPITQKIDVAAKFVFF